MDPQLDPASAGWHIDRRIPLALIVTLAVQTAGVAFWLGQITAEVSTLKIQIQQASTNNDRLTRIEVQLNGLGVSMEKLEAKLEASR